VIVGRDPAGPTTLETGRRTLVSQDSGWYAAGEPGGGNYKDYNAVFTHLIPEMKKNGFTAAEIDGLFIANPANAFAVKVRGKQGGRI